MKSSAGSDAFALLALAAIVLFVLLLLRHFLPIRTTPAYLTVPVFLALALPLSIFLLVPIDLASSSRNSEDNARSIWLPDGVILVVWRLAYWLTFALTWFILPLLGEYADSGYRSPRDRILHSLRSNGKYQLIMVLCAGGGAIYVFLVNGFQGASVKSLVMALAYCWGLVMAIYLMGHGLVAIPRRLFRDANPSGRLRRIQSQAPKVKDRLDDATIELEDLEVQLTQLRRRKNAVSRDHEEWIEEISDASTHSSVPPSIHAGSSRTPPLPAVITDRYLGDFSRKLMRARHARQRFGDSWFRLLQDALEASNISDASTSHKLEFKDDQSIPLRSRQSRFLTPYTRYLLHLKILPALRLVLGALLSLASLCVVWSELIKFIAPQLSIISLTVLSSRSNEAQISFAGQVTAALWLLYMSVAALASFDDVKIWGNRALVRRNTYGESATWYASQIAKLTVPLAYNFITFLPPDVHRRTQFFKFLGVLINLTPLGKYFDYLFPVFILVPVGATLFSLYGRIKRILGFEIVTDGDDNSSGTGNWREGRELIDRELRSMARLGLADQLDGTSSSLPSEARSPLSSQSRSDNLRPSTRPAVARQSTEAQRQAQRLADATAAAAAAEEEGDEEGFFQGFAHRIKNTIDAVERPEWMNEFGKKPKWMGGNDGSSEASGRVGSSNGLGRWLGGRSADGQIRL